jgi:EC042_2821-lke REase/Protein of unknown function (DUF3644)
VIDEGKIMRINYRGSSRKLAGNSTAAMVAAVEVYNKPRFEYRDEVVVILVMNAWELLLKAIVSKAGKSIYEKKERGKPYRTLTWGAAFWVAVDTNLWPEDISGQAVYENIELLSLYRNSAEHYYNEPDFGQLIYSLIQTGLFNFRDLLNAVGLGDICKEITWQILPLGFDSPFDPVSFLRGSPKEPPKRSAPVSQYLARVQDSLRGLEQEGIDTGRFLTMYNVHLVSTKKVHEADITVGVVPAGELEAEAVVIPRQVDPNESHPYLQKDVVRKMKDLHPNFTTRSFQAIVWKYGLRNDKRYVWVAKNFKGIFQWSGDTLAFIKRLKPTEIENARKEYSKHLRDLKTQSK